MWRKTRRTQKAMAALLVLLETMMNNVKVQKRFMTNQFAVKGWVQTFHAIICHRIANEVQAVEKWFNTTKCMDEIELEDGEMDDKRYSELRALHREILRLSKTLKMLSELGHVPTYDIPAKELLGQ